MKAVTCAMCTDKHSLIFQYFPPWLFYDPQFFALFLHGHPTFFCFACDDRQTNDRPTSYGHCADGITTLFPTTQTRALTYRLVSCHTKSRRPCLRGLQCNQGDSQCWSTSDFLRSSSSRAEIQAEKSDKNQKESTPSCATPHPAPHSRPQGPPTRRSARAAPMQD